MLLNLSEKNSFRVQNSRQVLAFFTFFPLCARCNFFQGEPVFGEEQKGKNISERRGEQYLFPRSMLFFSRTSRKKISLETLRDLATFATPNFYATQGVSMYEQNEILKLFPVCSNIRLCKIRTCFNFKTYTGSSPLALGVQLLHNHGDELRHQVLDRHLLHHSSLQGTIKDDHIIIILFTGLGPAALVPG